MKNGLTATRTKGGDEEKRLKVFSGKEGVGTMGSQYIRGTTELISVVRSFLIT